MAPPLEHNKTFTWNIITRNLRGHELLRETLHQKIAVLERHLQRFPPDAVHLLIELEKHPRKIQYHAVLTLRLPSHILHSNKSAKTVIAALSNAVRALLHEIEALKQRLRQEPEWKRRERRKQLTFATKPTAEGIGPQTESDVRNAFFEQHRRRLLRFARRAVVRSHGSDQALANGEIAGLVGDAKDKLAALSRRKSKAASDRALLYRLVRDAVGRAGRSANRSTSPIVTASVAERGDGESTSASQLLPAMDRILASFPETEREIFDLYFVEGFEPDEIVMITSKSLTDVNEAIKRIKYRIRKDLSG